MKNSKFDTLYNQILNEGNETITNQGIGDWFKKKKNNSSDKAAMCKKLWNDKNYDKLADQIKEYKKDKQFAKDPDAQFYYGMLLVKDLINESELILKTKFLLSESREVKTDQSEINTVWDISKKDYRKTLLKAKMGNKDALYDLAVYYYVGINDVVPQDIEKAIKLFKKAAKKGCPEAQYNLGVMYERGFDPKDKEHENEFQNYIQKDEDKAFIYYKRAYENGYKDAKEPYEYLLNKKKNEAKDSLDILNKENSTNQAKVNKGIEYIKYAAKGGCKEAIEFLKKHLEEVKNQRDFYDQTMALYNKNSAKI